MIDLNRNKESDLDKERRRWFLRFVGHKIAEWSRYRREVILRLSGNALCVFVFGLRVTKRVDLRGVVERPLDFRVELFHRSNSSCGARCGALVIRAIVVAAGEQGAFTTELAQDRFSHSPPRVNGLERGGREAPASWDQSTEAVFASSLLR